MAGTSRRGSWGVWGAPGCFLGETGPGPHECLLEAILRLKMAQDRRRWPKVAPKHENRVKYE